MNLKDLKNFARSGYKVLTDVTMELSVEEWRVLAKENPYVFKGVQFNHVDFGDGSLMGFDFRESKWADSTLSGIVSHCNFAGSYFTYSNFSNARVKNCNFSKCVIRGIQCLRATFSQINFHGSSISGLYFNGTKYIHNINLQNTFVELGVLDGVNLSTVRGVSSVHINGLDDTVYCIHSNDDSPIHFRIGYDWKPMTYFIENPEHPYSGAAKFLGGYYAKLPY